MPDPHIHAISPYAKTRPIAKPHIFPTELEIELLFQEIEQIATAENLVEMCEEGFNTLEINRNFRTLDEQQKVKGKKERTESARTTELEEAELFVTEIQKEEDSAERFQQNNPELRKQTLLLLRKAISEHDSVDEILRKVLNFYPDYSLADEALDFLIETSSGDLYEKVRLAKEEFNRSHLREILAGRNIHLQARLFSQQGLGSPTALREMYRDITGNPRSPLALFNQLTTNFDFEKMRTVIRFLLHSLGADLKSKGPSIGKPELMRLLEDTRILQAILGIFRFFQSRMNLLRALFEKNNLTFPSKMTFESLAKQFMSLFDERYISQDKILQLASKLGLSEEIIAQILVFTQMRDAIRQIAPRLFKNQQQKDDLINAFLETLEELEEEMEKEEEKKDPKKRQKEDE
jgi:type III secretion protein W